jgi:hypothetical protein
MDCGEVMCVFKVHVLHVFIDYFGDVYMHVDSIYISLYIDQREERAIHKIYFT